MMSYGKVSKYKTYFTAAAGIIRNNFGQNHYFPFQNMFTNLVLLEFLDEFETFPKLSISIRKGWYLFNVSCSIFLGKDTKSEKMYKYFLHNCNHCF